MTDSESDTSNNVFTFPTVNTTVSAKGPNTNITNLSFRNQMTSTMYMPRNFERQRYAESACDQRSMYYRRETSPMSIHSACDIRPRNFQQYYPGMSSQQSVFNGRSGSPMSMRSIDSSASVSAADIAFAFKNVKFNKYDLKVIKDAYHKLMKQRVRKRIEKRRNMRLFLKGSRRRSGGDSGDQGSNSSISSDDCRSIKTSYKENMSSSRSARIDLSDFRKTVRDSNMLKDCSENFRQNTFKNKFSFGSTSVHNTQNFNNTFMSLQSNPMPTQKDRFRNGFLLPSQRFNRSVASTVIPENSEKNNKKVGNAISNVKNHYAQNKHNKNNNCTSGSEEEIFAETTVREKSTFNIETQRKRSLDSEDDSSLPDRKKTKISSPIKNIQKSKNVPLKVTNFSNNNNAMSNSFEFVKPALPIRKSKPRIQEKLIAKSAQPLTDFLEPIPNKIQEKEQDLHPSNLQEKSSENLIQHDQSETTQNSDVSTRPSFIKRKLFTQRLDVAEKANLSSDGTNSPQSTAYSLQKEKNKARKLVTNQSCLNRDVQDDNNLLDLIHKIVPPDRMNITNQTTINQTKIDTNSKNTKDNEDKWDVTSVLSMCNDEDVSDTYTDEEIFEPDNTKKTNKKDTNKNNDLNSKVNQKPVNKVVNNSMIPRDCRIMVEKLQNNNTLQKQVVNQNFSLTHNNITKNDVKSSAKTFWDTDLESDVECQTVLPRSNIIDNLNKANATLNTTKPDFKKPTISLRDEVPKKSQQNMSEVPKQFNNTFMNNTIMNNTVDSMRKFNTSTLTVRSHRTSVKKKCCNETCAKDTKSKYDTQNKLTIDKVSSNEPSKKSTVKSNSKDTESNILTDISKSKLNTQNEKNTKARSTSQTRKSPKEKQPNKGKEVENTSNSTKKSESKSKTENNKQKSKAETQSNGSGVKNKVQKQNESTEVKPTTKPNAQTHKNKKEIQKSPKNKPKTKNDRHNTSTRSKKTSPLPQPTKPNLNHTVEPQKTIRSDRPVRSCRTPIQSRSIELSRSSLHNNTSDMNKSLRSRVINLSSSIENITIKIKPRNKTINKNISTIKTRKSDVSFSIGSDKQTPTPKKSLPRRKADFFKCKRKT